MSAELQAGWSSSYVRMPDGKRLHVESAGPADGRPIFLLHGFPGFWSGWRHQISPLAQARFRVLVPDQRGYATFDVPSGVAANRLDALVADVFAIADAHARRFDLAGHDWGGIIAWAVAARHGGRIKRLSILNAPHLDLVLDVMRGHPSQASRSSYVGLFQLTGVAEMLLRARNFALLKRMIIGRRCRRRSHGANLPPTPRSGSARADSQQCSTTIARWSGAGARG